MSIWKGRVRKSTALMGAGPPPVRAEQASMWRGRSARVGGDRYQIIGDAGSYIGHTPGQVEDELDQLHGEIMAFGNELQLLVDKDEAKRIADSGDTALAQMVDEYQKLKATEQTFVPLVRQIDAIKEKLGTDPESPTILFELRDAMLKIDQIMPTDQRVALVLRMRVLADQIAAAKARLIGDNQAVPPTALEMWARNAWAPFWNTWEKFRELKKKPAQTWPLSGTWDRIQDYRQQFGDLYRKAPFKPSGVPPLDPKDRRDPSLFGDVGSVVKWAAIGVLAIGGAFLVTSLVTSAKQGRDPVEHYVGLYRGKRAAGTP